MVDSAQFEDRFVTVNNLRFHYVDWGNESMPVMIFLPGLSGTGHDWDFIASSLQGQYHCLGLDQRGQGDSDRADSYEASDFTSDIAHFVDAAKFDTVSLLGHSLGARTAMFYAATYPEKVAKLVIVDAGAEIDTRLQGPPPPRTKDTFGSLDDFVQFQQQRYPMAKEEAVRHCATYSTKILPDGRLTYKHDAKLEESAMKMRVVGQKVVMIGWELLGQIKCPTLIIRGANSNSISPEVGQRMVDTIPQAELVTIEGAGHAIHLDNPNQLKQVVLRFLG